MKVMMVRARQAQCTRPDAAKEAQRQHPSSFFLVSLRVLRCPYTRDIPLPGDDVIASNFLFSW